MNMQNKRTPFVLITTILTIIAAGAAASAQSITNQAVNAVDQKFVTQAANANYDEIAESRAQLAHTNDPSVRLYAQTMIRDHTNANVQLQAQAQRLGLSFPSGPSATPQTMSGRAYMQQQVTDHQQTIALFKGEESNGGDQSLKTYAGTMLPILYNHLAMAQQYVQTGRVTPRSTPTP